MPEDEDYMAGTGKSAELYSRARRVMPGGISHAIRFYPPYPFYVEGAQGSRIWDVDGNEYIDYWMGHGALILGHTPSAVIEAMREQATTGCQWGSVNELQVELAELLVELVPCAEKVRFCNTGAEATMYACRLARGFTGRSVIAKMEGGWHGFNPTLMAAIHPPFGHQESLGLDGAEKNTVALPFNNLEGSLSRIREIGEDLSAIILEPVLGSGGFVPAGIEYLRGLREVADEVGALLVFDEIITGFRVALGGGQEYFGVKPDLTTLGKILGGGMPIGAVVGRDDIMELSDTINRPGEAAVAIGGGTFSANPMSMRAGLETLQYLHSHRGIYDRIGSLGDLARKAIEKSLEIRDRCVKCTGIGSLFRTHFAYRDDERILSARDAVEKADPELQDWFKIALANRGIYILGGGGAISEAHVREDISRLGEACTDASERLSSTQ